MIVDASVAAAVILGEPSVIWIRRTIDAYSTHLRRMSWVNIAETEIAVARARGDVPPGIESFFSAFGIEPLETNFEVARLIAHARVHFPLHFGDCFAYAHARLLNEPLLTLDADFLKTDLSLVLHPDRTP